jgi:Asp-tRNA(Asn)/Glu-tRNA(Gln) amidotransferase A subunit family amidase
VKYATKKLKFGYYFDDGITIASPPVKRAVEMTAKALQAKGYDVVELVPPNIIEVVHCFVALTTYERSPSVLSSLRAPSLLPTCLPFLLYPTSFDLVPYVVTLISIDI